jgi:hypothetical protein
VQERQRDTMDQEPRFGLSEPRPGARGDDDGVDHGDRFFLA